MTAPPSFSTSLRAVVFPAPVGPVMPKIFIGFLSSIQNRLRMDGLYMTKRSLPFTARAGSAVQNR